MTGNEYADLVAAYLLKNYGLRGLTIYREVSLGKSIIGKNRKIDILAVHEATSVALGIECKYQATPGTADEKIPYTLADLEAMHLPAFVSYAGEGFSVGVKHMLESHKLAAYCEPDVSLLPGKKTVELDHVVAMIFGFWDKVLSKKQPFSLDAYKPPSDAPLAQKSSSDSEPSVKAPAAKPSMGLHSNEELFTESAPRDSSSAETESLEA